MPLPLEGIRVLDWTIWQQGPICSLMLGDLGADVIKIESRAGGDPGRGVLRAQGLDVGSLPNFYFEANNRGKRSIALDVQTAEGREIVHRLAEKADVFVQNFRPGAAERAGLGYADLRARNPRIVYASGSGFGRSGPDAERPCMDYLGLARSGIMMAVGEPGSPPLAIQGAIADQMGGTILAFAVMTALLVRERTGVGQEVDASLLGAMSWLQGLSLSARLMLGNEMPRFSRRSAFNPLWNHYRCKDDRWIAFAMAQADRWWKDFVRVLGRPDLGEDERYATMVGRGMNAAEIISILDEIFASRTSAEWAAALDDGGDFIFTLVNAVNDLPNDPQVRANGLIASVAHPTSGTAEMLNLPIRLSATPPRIAGSAPEHGQHTEQVLVEELGYGWDAVAALKEKQVI
ncbi:MAG TPA: CoA transferase [Candidatus Binatia bacterium]|nr:CoA transferase [Candidatus Binatia bacterium]